MQHKKKTREEEVEHFSQDDTRGRKHSGAKNDDGMSFADFTKSQLKSGVITQRVAEHIKGLGHHFAKDAGGKLWYYKNGVYVPDGDEKIKQLTKRAMYGTLALGEHWSTRQAEQVVEYIRLDAPDLWDRPPLDRVNVLNGILNVETRDLEPHTPLFLSPIQIPVTYAPTATCPEWEKFTRSIFPSDVLDLAWELPAWLMLPMTSIQKAVLLLGAGGNGKSTYLTALTAFIGKKNTSTLPLQKLEADRFAVSRLVGKLANICADLPSQALAGTSMFKAITGGDSITGEYKFRESFDFTPFSRLIFSANEPPKSNDASDGFYDRWLAVPFTGRFRGTAQEISRKEMDAKLASPRELSGVLNKALDALARLKETNRFTEGESTRSALDDFREVTDPFTIWLRANLVADPEGMVACEDARRAYNKHCQATGHSPCTEMAFTQGLRRIMPLTQKRQRTIGGKPKVWCYVGIRMGTVNEQPSYSEMPKTPCPTCGKTTWGNDPDVGIVCWTCRSHERKAS